MPKFVLCSTLTHDENEKNLVCFEGDEDSLCSRGAIDTRIYKTVMVWNDKDLVQAKKTAEYFGYPV